jgi:hypothetical protein
MSRKTFDPISAGYVTDTLVEIQDFRSTNLSYIGRSQRHGANYSEPVWQIQRIYKVGNVTLSTFVGSGNYKYRWTDREALFSGIAYTNDFSIYFDGVNDYVSFGNNLNFDIATAVSYSFWIKPQNVSATRYWYGKMTADTASTGLRIGHDATGRVVIQARPAGQGLAPITFTTAMTPGNWSHVVVTFAGNSNQNGWRVYTNGVLDATVPASTAYSGSLIVPSDAQFGAARATSHFSGNCDELSIWGISLAPAQVAELYNSGSPASAETHSAQASLLHYWRCGDGDSPTTIADLRGNVTGALLNGAAAIMDAP